MTKEEIVDKYTPSLQETRGYEALFNREEVLKMMGEAELLPATLLDAPVELQKRDVINMICGTYSHIDKIQEQKNSAVPLPYIEPMELGGGIIAYTWNRSALEALSTSALWALYLEVR